MADRALSFYMKGLAIDVRQRLFACFKNDISDIMIKHFLEKEDGYPSFRSILLGWEREGSTNCTLET